MAPNSEKLNKYDEKVDTSFIKENINPNIQHAQ